MTCFSHTPPPCLCVELLFPFTPHSLRCFFFGLYTYPCVLSGLLDLAVLSLAFRATAFFWVGLLPVSHCPFLLSMLIYHAQFNFRTCCPFPSNTFVTPTPPTPTAPPSTSGHILKSCRHTLAPVAFVCVCPSVFLTRAFPFLWSTGIIHEYSFFSTFSTLSRRVVSPSTPIAHVSLVLDPSLLSRCHYASRVACAALLSYFFHFLFSVFSTDLLADLSAARPPADPGVRIFSLPYLH